MNHNKRKDKATRRKKKGTGFAPGTIIEASGRKYIVTPEGSWRVYEYTRQVRQDAVSVS